MAVHDGAPLYVELPDQRRARHHLHRSGSAGRPVHRRHQARHVETGAEIQVPLFVSTGEKVKVDTRDGRYLGRVSG